MLTNLEASLTFNKPPTAEDLKNLEERGTELFGGRDNVYVEIKQIRDREYQLVIYRK